jgi:hypothetical protein
MVSIQVATSNHDIRLSGELRMTPNRQSSAYAPYAQSPLPCCAANSASSSALTMEYPARRIALSLLRIKIGRQDNHRAGGVAANFERLRETKDLSALAQGNYAHPRLSSHSARVARRNYHANHAIFPRVMIDLMAHMAHNGTCFPPPWRTCRGSEAERAYRRLQNNHTHPRTRQFSMGEILSESGYPAWRTSA